MIIDKFNRFLLARLHMESLMSWLTPGHLKRALKHLPKELDGTYTQAVQRIEVQDEGAREPARRLITWITYAKRELTIREVQHALAVGSDPDMKDFDDEFLLDVDILTSICAGLVIVDQTSKTIRLIHYTTQEYFLRTSMFPKERQGIAATCISYLSFDAFNSGPCSTVEAIDDRIQRYPLYDYVTRNWGYHYSEAAEEGLGRKVLDLLLCEEKVASYGQLFLYDEYSTISHRTLGSRIRASHSLSDTDLMVAMHWGAYFGLSEEVKALITRGHDVEPAGTHRRTPLSWAAERGHDIVVGLLLRKNPNLEARDKSVFERTPLLWAVESGHEKVVELLLEAGADLQNRDTNWGLTPLAWAAADGHTPIARLLISKKANVNATYKDWGMTALSWAALRGREEVVELLLQNGADTEVMDHYQCTPLAFAIHKRYEGTVRLLLKHGAKMNYTYFRVRGRLDGEGPLDLRERRLPDPRAPHPKPYQRESMGKYRSPPKVRYARQWYSLLALTPR